ncbi:MAG: helix-turn-helix transcriptional regulator [Acidobacteriota bacterium]|nr:helix-turn-helix transcriptional regulator [Acidobacteriota bacterium]
MASIVATLQEAAFDEDRWAAASAAVDDACGAMASHLAVLSDSGEAWPFRFSQLLRRGVADEEAERIYVEECAFRDERVPRLADLPYARLIHNTEIYTAREQKTSPVYAGVLPRIGSNNQLNVRLAGRNDSEIVWVLTREASSDWTSGHIALLNGLLPHVEHFVNVRQALAEADTRTTSLAGLIDSAGLGVVFLDGRGRVLEVNAQGRSILQAGRCLSERGGRLRARWRADGAKLNKLLTAACRDGVGGSMSLQALDGPLVLHACPIPPDRGCWDTRGVAAHVLLTEPRSIGPIDPGPVAAALGLTPTESEMAAWLAEGRTVGEIAVSTGRKESTVRWHIRNLHSKLGVHRQADLVRLVLSTAAATPPVRRVGSEDEETHPGRQQ